MKMRGKAIALAMLVLVVGLLLLVSCNWTGGGAGDLNATATYGAEMFHIQLTAVAAP